MLEPELPCWLIFDELEDDGEDELLGVGELIEPLMSFELFELLDPRTPSAASVWLSSCPELLMFCWLWNCFTADSVFGPSCPSIGPGSKPLSFNACCAWLTSLWEDACWLDWLLDDMLGLADDVCFDESPFAIADADDKTNAAMMRCVGFTIISFPLNGVRRRKDVPVVRVEAFLSGSGRRQ